MITDKIYIADKQAFIEWKRKYTTHTGKFYAECYCEKEPKSYPCILLEIDEYNTKWGEYDSFYHFVYLTDFISNYEKL